MTEKILWLSNDPEERRDVRRHNYAIKIAQLREAGKIPAGQSSKVDVYHDDWCAIYSGGYCNCDPDIKVKWLRGRVKPRERRRRRSHD